MPAIEFVTKSVVDVLCKLHTGEAESLEHVRWVKQTSRILWASKVSERKNGRMHRVAVVLEFEKVLFWLGQLIDKRAFHFEEEVTGIRYANKQCCLPNTI